MREPRLETGRLLLEPIREAHAPLLHGYLQDRRLYQWIPQDPLTLDQLKARYRRLETRQSPDGKEAWLNWALKLKHQDLYVGTLEATVRPNGVADIAYFIFPGFWRCGLAREACQRLISHLFDDWPISTVRATIDIRNEPSIALVESMGLVRTGMTANADHFKGSVSDEYVYCLSRRR